MIQRCQANDSSGLKQIGDKTNELMRSGQNLKINDCELPSVLICLIQNLRRSQDQSAKKPSATLGKVLHCAEFTRFFTQRFTMLEWMCTNQQHRIFECERSNKTDVQARHHVVKFSKLVSIVCPPATRLSSTLQRRHPNVAR